jgi:hypothetical protein
MVKDGEGCYVKVKPLGITKVVNPHVVYYGINENLDATLSSLIGLVVMEWSSPSSFGTNTVDARSFRVDCRVIIGWTSG